jgi:hypothetical protein
MRIFRRMLEVKDRCSCIFISNSKNGQRKMANRDES